MVKKLNLGKN